MNPLSFTKNSIAIKRGKFTQQSGVILIEVLVAILIFALGILGIIGLYAVTN